MSLQMQRTSSHIVTKVVETPWMITEPSLNLILEILNHHLRTGESMEGRCDDFRMDTGGPRNGARADRSVAVLPLYGPIFPRANMMTKKGNATSLEQFRGELNALIDNPLVSSIVLDIDSPGGMSDLLPETVADIRAGREVKPIVAVSNTAANSAAYYIASATDRLFASPSAQVGSIGVYTLHENRAKKLEQEGVEVTVVSAGEYKAERAQHQALSPEARDWMQGYVDAQYEEFVASVAEGRGTNAEDVLANFGKGRVVNAKDALAVGMVDGIATLESVVADMAQGGDSVVRSSQRPIASFGSKFATRTSYDADKEHSEPGTGTGGEPTPRTPPEEGDRGIAGGWRRQTPPIELETEESVMGREQLVALAEKLGLKISEDATDEQVTEAITRRTDEVIVPMLEVKEEHDNRRSFEKDYPEEAARMAKLERIDRENDARKFADQYERFEDSTKGFSSLAVGKIEEAHLALANGEFTAESLEQLLDTFKGDAVVEYGEQGSSRSRQQETPPEQTSQDIRQHVKNLVDQRMAQDEIGFKPALALVAEENPELYAAYLAS